MFEYTLNPTAEKKYTALPSPVADRVSVWLTRNNIDHQVLSMEDVPEDVPQGYAYHGRKSVYGVAYIYANIDPDELLTAVDKMRGIPTEKL